MVVLWGAGPLHARPAAAASARRARHQPALLVQLRHRGRGLRRVRARRSLRQPHHVSAPREWRDESHPAKARAIAATTGRTQKNNCSRAAGVNDAPAAEVIQVDVSLARYAGVEMVAAIKRARAQAGTIRQTI